jgi:hypothetical protein
MPDLVKVTQVLSIERAAQVARTGHHRQRVALGVDEHGHTLKSFCGSLVVAGLQDPCWKLEKSRRGKA